MVAGAILLAAGLSQAQPISTPLPITPPDPAPEQRREQERQIEQQRRQQPSVDVRLPAPEAAAGIATRIPQEEAPCFAIQSIELVGADANQFLWVLDHLAGPQSDDSPLRRCLGAEGINVVLKRAQDAVIARGFVTSRVLAQPQDISQGRLALSVIAGRIREVRYAGSGNGPSAASTASLLRAPALTPLPLRSGEILNLRDIEQALEMLKRVPTAEADIKIEPGTAPGESDLFITYQQAMPLRANISYDDSGSKGTGRYQGALTLSYDNPLLLSDLFYITLNRDIDSHGTKGTQARSIHYSVPFGYWTLALNTSESSYDQTVAGASQDYIYSGTSSNASAKLTRLVQRDAVSKTNLSFSGFARRSRNFIDDAEVQVQRRNVGGWELGFNHRRYLGQATLEGNLNYKRGTGAFNSLQAPEETRGEGTSRFKLLTADLNYSQPFKVGEQAVNYSSTWRAQWNRSPLTPQDRFSIGSRYSVRGFDGESGLSAERGWTWRNDWGLPLGQSGQQLYMGLDYGRVGGPSSKLLVGKVLAGAALGLRGGFKGLQYDVFVGTPVRKPQFFRTADTSFGFNLNYSF
jgi:hemolysin activation/secretion protein